MGLIYEEVLLTTKEHELISSLVYNRFGIVLSEKKRSLISGRLQKILRMKGFTTFHEYYNYILNDNSGAELQLLIDKLSTNHTYFFREEAHFDFLTERVLPELMANNKILEEGQIRIWSGAASTGEEIYTLKMVAEEFFKNKKNRVKVKILGTDISENVLKSAVLGIYPAEKLEKLPKNIIYSYFSKLPDGNYKVIPKLQEDILFKKLNLMDSKYPYKNKFHTVFLRNVMIYFDEKTKLELVNRIAGYMEHGAYLFIGLSETIGQNNPNFKYIQPSVYQKR